MAGAATVRALRPPNDNPGEEHVQETIKSADASGGVNLVPAAAGRLGVLDDLYLSFGGTVNIEIDDGANDNQLVETVYGILGTNVHIKGPIHGSTVNNVIDLTASGAVAISAFWRWHYEIVDPT